MPPRFNFPPSQFEGPRTNATFRPSSLSRCKPRIGQHPRRAGGFTLIEILIVVAIIAVLATIAFMASRRMISSARTATCLSNLRQMHTIAMLETTDRGFFPPALSQTTGSSGIKNNGDHFSGLTDSLSCTSCPDAKFHGTNPKNSRPYSAYGTNPAIIGYHVTNESDGTPAPPTQPFVRPYQITRPSEVFLLTDNAQFASGGGEGSSIGFSAIWWGNQTGKVENAQKELTTALVPTSGFWDNLPLIPFRHDGKANIVFVDGHAVTIKRLGNLKEKNLYWNY